MQVNIHSALNLFALPLQYEIPIYQRPYVWDEERQWQPLWEDVERTAEEQLHPPANGTNDHFMGAIVVQATPQVGSIGKWLVIDGQQRLTTLQILLDAVQLALANAGPSATGPAQQLHSLVENQPFNYDTQSSPEHRFKVWPTAGDQDAFESAMTRTDPSDRTANGEPRLVRAHHFFEEQAKDWLAQEPSLLESRANALAHSLTNRLKVVAIQLDGNDNPNVIFETLNARGTPLLDWDLTKNFLLHQSQLGGQDPDLIYRQHFQQLEKDEWWREDAQRGSVYKPRIDLYLYNWLILRTAAMVDADRVFVAFDKYAAGRDPSELAQDLATAARHYSEIEQGLGSAIWQDFLAKWQALQAGVTMPYLLWLKEAEVQQRIGATDLERCLLALESYFVRRAVCRIASRGLNRYVPELLKRLAANPQANPADTFVDVMSSVTAPAAEWPDDRSFRDHLLNGKMYRQLTRRRTRLVLEGIEAKLAHRATAVIKQHQSLFIEHLLPQSYLPHYQLTKTTIDEEETPQQQRERLIHTLGNLSLTTSKMGIAMSNGGWKGKAPQLAKSGLALNLDVLQNSGSTWTDDDIVERGKRLSDVAVDIWPPPQNI